MDSFQDDQHLQYDSNLKCYLLNVKEQEEICIFEAAEAETSKLQR